MARIIGGSEARPGQFPSAAAIYATKEDGTYFCVGALANPQHVLTAAHCVTSYVKPIFKSNINQLFLIELSTVR